MKFCCSGDQEYMTGTEATALRVFRGMTCLGNSEKPLSTVHCRGKAQSENVLCTFSTCLRTEDAVNQLTSRVPLKELTDVMMWTGWIRLVFHSWFKMSVRSIIFWRLVLNMLCKSSETCNFHILSVPSFDNEYIFVYSLQKHSFDSGAQSDKNIILLPW